MSSPLSTDRPPPPSAPSPSSTTAPQSIDTILLPASTARDYSPPSSASSSISNFRGDWPSSSAQGSSQHPDEFEMEPIAPSGHRRRRSTLTTSLNGVSANSRPRSQSVLDGNSSEAKITEEDPDFNASKTELSGQDGLSDEDLHDDEETGLAKKDKRRIRAKKKRNTRLDQRIARDKITDEARKEADQNVLRNAAINGLLIMLWYIFSLSISLYNKWMFDSDRLNFPFPLFTTSFHMLVQFSLAGLVLFFKPSLRPYHSQKFNEDSSRSGSEPDQPKMTKMFYLTRIGPCGAATGLDIGLGNMSLKFITLTFYTMCKSSSLAFVLIFAFVFRLEQPTLKLIAIIAAMTAGVIMMVAGEVEFQISGFLLVISAAFFSGFRWGLTQILLLRNPATSNPFSSIFFLAPVMFVTLLAIAIPVEGVFAWVEGLKGLSERWGVLPVPFFLLFPGTIAFLMTASEFALLQRTSVVTLSIAGIFKEVVTISAAALVFDDKLTPINISGLVITIASIAAYNWLKFSNMRNQAQQEAQNKGYQQVLTVPEEDIGHESDEEDAGLLQHAETRPVEAEDDLFALESNQTSIAPSPVVPPRTNGF